MVFEAVQSLSWDIVDEAQWEKEEECRYDMMLLKEKG